MARRFWFRIAALIALVVVCLAAVLAVRGAGRWLVREDPLRPSDVIVVLSGSMPWRAEEAARIFSLGDAREVWVSHPAAPVDELASMGIPYVGEEYFSREVLIHSGVPAAAIRVLPDPIADTEQEVAEVAREMRREQETSAIIVTSPQHTRRVKALWNKIVGDHPRLIVRAAFQDPFDADHWWHTTADTFSVVREFMGLLNVWLGLPVRPRPAA
ncbi:MAG TPA: YdcF family protein [Candidatus Acidoferrales bacterium]|nr:YdcF family protein [Candidatus Acidoferrales bacterium]